MDWFEIPLISVGQKFQISLNGVTYIMRVHWCLPGNFWALDIANQNDVPIVQGIPLIPGGDLLQQYGYLNFGGELHIVTDYDSDAPPTATNLGSQSHLYFVT